MASHREGVGFCFGLLVGTLVGASIAVLLTPQSGGKTRQLLLERARDVQERASDFAHDVLEDYHELLERGRAHYKRRGERQEAEGPSSRGQ